MKMTGSLNLITRSDVRFNLSSQLLEAPDHTHAAVKRFSLSVTFVYAPWEEKSTLPPHIGHMKTSKLAWCDCDVGSIRTRSFWRRRQATTLTTVGLLSK